MGAIKVAEGRNSPVAATVASEVAGITAGFIITVATTEITPKLCSTDRRPRGPTDSRLAAIIN